MHPNASIVERLYTALDATDGDAMASLYTPDATFEDPAFGRLEGPEVGAMWRMLCSQARDLSASVSDIEADEHEGSARWQATYTFSATGRHVENRIEARYRFRDGLIADHRDRFSIWRWSRQALGPAALLLGSNPAGAALIRRRARGQLAAWQGREGSGT